MQELALIIRHRLVTHADFVGALRKHAELTLLRLAPCRALFEEAQSRLGIGHMVVGVRGWVNVEGGSEAAVTLETQALVVAFDFRPFRVWVGIACEASDLLSP